MTPTDTVMVVVSVKQLTDRGGNWCRVYRGRLVNGAACGPMTDVTLTAASLNVAVVSTTLTCWTKYLV